MVRFIALCALIAGSLVADVFAPDDVKILGDLDYGQSSDPVEYTATPRFRAFVFAGKGGDRIEVTVKAEDRKAVIAIADGGLHQLASGTTQLSFQLPEKGPDAEAYYIVFRDSEDKTGRFTVSLNRVR